MKGISSQSTLLNNFSPVEPISTCNTPIDSAQQEETRGIVKTFANPILVEHYGKF
jgi:hypothetical protein